MAGPSGIAEPTQAEPLIRLWPNARLRADDAANSDSAPPASLSLVPVEISPYAVNVIGFVLRVVVFDQKSTPLHSVVVSFAFL